MTPEERDRRVDDDHDVLHGLITALEEAGVVEPMLSGGFVAHGPGPTWALPRVREHLEGLRKHLLSIDERGEAAVVANILEELPGA
jgi:hypothetical protein